MDLYNITTTALKSKFEHQLSGTLIHTDSDVHGSSIAVRKMALIFDADKRASELR
jgi:hypothetical protein